MTVDELRAVVEELAAHPEQWQHLVEFTPGRRHYASLRRDDDVDVWLLCWNSVDDTGWHDHGDSSGAVRVVAAADGGDRTEGGVRHGPHLRGARAQPTGQHRSSLRGHAAKRQHWRLIVLPTDRHYAPQDKTRPQIYCRLISVPSQLTRAYAPLLLAASALSSHAIVPMLR